MKAGKGVELALESARTLSAHLSKTGRDSGSTQDIQNAFNALDTARDALQRLQEPKEIDLKPSWRRAKYKDLIREKAGADWFEITREERLFRAVNQLDIDLGYSALMDIVRRSGQSLRAAHSKALGETEKIEILQKLSKQLDLVQAMPEDFEVTGAVFEKLIEPTLIQPTFVTHLPKELVPLAKLSPDDPTTVEVFECCINGQEISPGYTEQNDPIAQRTTLEHQAGGEQQKLDEDFLIALEHGMPPAGGIGIGIDRLCMMLLGQESIRDVILFPQLKPK